MVDSSSAREPPRRTSGAKRIFLYNWPIYAATWTSAAALIGVACYLGGPLAWLVAIGALGAALWSAVSLAVSYYVYDRSVLAGGSWLRAYVPEHAATWAAVDAGLDAEVALEGAMPSACVAHLDIYDGEIVHAPSVQRARSITPRAHAATPSRATSLALDDASCDVIAVVFTAHEIRDRAAREAFFFELRRALRDDGRVLLVEHLRDVPNFFAFGPGFVHFQWRAEWLRLARVAGLRVAREGRVTPWVMALALDKAAPEQTQVPA